MTANATEAPPHSPATQIRQAIRAAMADEPLGVRAAAYQFHNSASDEALERLVRMIK